MNLQRAGTIFVLVFVLFSNASAIGQVHAAGAVEESGGGTPPTDDAVAWDSPFSPSALFTSMSVRLAIAISDQALPAGLGRGVNFGNMLEAPNEGDWGFEVQSIFFDKVVEAGLDHIRLPISWTHHADTTAPFAIDEDFFLRIDWCIAQANLRGLKIIVNVHHYDELNSDPLAEWPRALSLWEQIATRYQNEPDTVFFEVLNEPHGEFNLNPEMWNEYMVDAIDVIRATNPTRKIMVGPTYWNSIDALATFSPPNDPNLIANVHFYAPFDFTHQGAGWVDPLLPVGRRWHGNRFQFGRNWQDWSWQTRFTPTKKGLRVNFDTGWAGARFHAFFPVSGADRLVLTTQRESNLQIQIIDQDGNSSPFVALQTGVGVNTYTIGFEEFGNPDSVQDVVFQNASADTPPFFKFRRIRLRGPGVVSHLIEREGFSLRSELREAARWSRANGIPIYLGEFGAYELADMPSRVRWTARVRKTCEEFGIDWGYWELVAGFGFYDSIDDAWRIPILKALVPTFEN